MPEEVKKNPNGLRYAYNQAHLPVREQDEASRPRGPCRRISVPEWLILLRLTEDDTLFDACKRLWDTVQKKLYITGGIGGTHMGEAFSF